jgi:hypothetical protein
LLEFGLGSFCFSQLYSNKLAKEMMHLAGK